VTLALFAGIRVGDLARAQEWYERLLGRPPSFFPNDVEAVWELADGRYVYIELDPPRAGHAQVTAFLDPPDELVTLVGAAATLGIEPALDETYDNGVRKVTYRDPDGNEIGFGAHPT
jgi:catechol 2,3-dioxygenase-like lactoylglutathione lyase family enzyme